MQERINHLPVNAKYRMLQLCSCVWQTWSLLTSHNMTALLLYCAAVLFLLVALRVNVCAQY